MNMQAENSALRRSDAVEAYRLMCELSEARAGTERVRLALSAANCHSFDRHFHEHPLVCFHAAHPQSGTKRISDFFTPHRFEHSGLFDDYYRPLGLNAVMAIPLHIDHRVLISIVVNRQGPDFTERERQFADFLRLGLAAQLREIFSPGASGWMPPTVPPTPANGPLTSREGEILHWVGLGKTNTEIAWIMTISPRTVQKHLEHIFDKLGVENRLSALMRVRPHQE
jgi:DNA-binding CsgD family transcriptional regulator